MKNATCPHCGKQTTAAALGRHAPVCLRNPVNCARIREQLTAYDDVGVTYSEYSARIVEQGAPGVTTLRRLTGFDAWDDVLAWFDLQPAVPFANVRTCPVCGKVFKALGYAHHAAKCAGGKEAAAIAAEVQQETEIVAYEGRVLQNEMTGGYGLSVAKVLPESLRVRANGREYECVRCILR